MQQANAQNIPQNPPIAELEKPVVLGRYHLLERLSAGGMGEVFLAVSQGTRGYFKFVAIKKMIKGSEKDDVVKRLFENEGRIGLNLSHGNLVQMYEASVADGELFYVMEYIEGVNLNSIIRQQMIAGNSLPLPTALHLLSEAAKGLAYIHSYVNIPCGIPHGIVHQDVSPQNIMLGFDGSVKLIDFGVAKENSTIEGSDLVVGKVGYMSPEQLRGSPATIRSDVFAFGVIMWELFTGRRLFTGPDAPTVKQLILNNTIPDVASINPKVPKIIRKIIHKALQYDPKDRYESGSALLGDLLHAAYHLDIVPHSEHLVAFLGQAFRREKEVRGRKTYAYTHDILKASILAPEGTQSALTAVTSSSITHSRGSGRTPEPSQKDYRELLERVSNLASLGRSPKVVLIRDGYCFMTTLAITQNGQLLMRASAPEAFRGKPCLIIIKGSLGVAPYSVCLDVGSDGQTIIPFALLPSRGGSYHSQTAIAA